MHNPQERFEYGSGKILSLANNSRVVDSCIQVKGFSAVALSQHIEYIADHLVKHVYN